MREGIDIVVARARKLLAASFKKIGNRETAIKIGKYESQVTRWRAGGTMTVMTAERIIEKLGHRRVK